MNNEQQNHDRSGSLEGTVIKRLLEIDLTPLTMLFPVSEFPPWAYAVIATVALVLAVALAITGIVIKRSM